MFRHVSKSGQTLGNISERHSETSNVSELSQLKMRYSPYVNKGFVYISVSKISTTIYIFMILEYNKLSRDNNQALQEHKMK